MKKRMHIWLAAALLLVVVLGRGGEQARPAAGGAQIPEKILETMDEDTREELTRTPKYVALTFDDGPRRGTTDRLLDGLLERGVCATFFVIGRQVEHNEDLLLRMAAEGHQVGNHTYSHVRLLTAEEDITLEEIQKTEVILKNLLGEGSYWLRPPYGLIDGTGAQLVKTPMIYWTLDPEDWKKLDCRQVVAFVMEHVESGDIVLMHDFYPTSVDAALELVDRLGEEGYTFVTVEELFRIQGVEPCAGCLYASPLKTRPLE